MLRRPKIEEREPREFDEELFQEELMWLKKVKDGKVLTSITPPEIYPAFFNAIIFTFILGITLGTALTYYTHNLFWIGLLPITIFAIVFYFSLQPYSTLHLDVKEEVFQYEGTIMYAGDEMKTRYRGSVKIIDKLQVIKHQRWNRINIRFITNSGYLKMNFNKKEDLDFLNGMEQLKLLNLAEIDDAITANTVLHQSGPWNIIYEREFDRTEFKKHMKEERQRKQQERLKAQEEKKRQLIEKSEKRKNKK